MTARAESFGAVAEAYERWRPGYPDEVVTLAVGHAAAPVRTALEIGAGTGKATRVLTRHGLQVTATDPDAAMLAVLRREVPGVRTRQARLEDLAPGGFDLVLAAACLHWADPADRVARLAAQLRTGGVAVTVGGAPYLADPRLAAAVEEVERGTVGAGDIPGAPEAPAGDGMRWPGTELGESSWFTDVRQVELPQAWSWSADDYVGLLSTVSAYLVAPAPVRREALARVRSELPDEVELRRDLVIHLARRVCAGRPDVTAPG